ncbi:unnamed protein product [Lepidochelys kempii]
MADAPGQLLREECVLWGSSMGTWPGYMPGHEYRPRLPPHPERAEGETDTSTTGPVAVPDSGFPARWLGPLAPHEYEDVMEPGIYEELGALHLQAPAPLCPGALPCQDYTGAYPWRGQSWLALRTP